MADEAVAVVSAATTAKVSPVPSSENKRKLEDLEQEAPEPVEPSPDQLNVEPDAAEVGVLAVAEGEAHSPDAKRPRLDDKLEELATRNGYQEDKVGDESSMENVEQPKTMEGSQLEDAEPLPKEVQEAVEKEKLTADTQTGGAQQSSVENSPTGDEQEPSAEQVQQPSAEIPQQEDVYPVQQQTQEPTYEAETTSRKMEVPNKKVGVLIGKAGDTIRYLQYNSGAKIQITRDADADPHSLTRPVELIGTLENINKAEKLIKDVIAEADAGGSPSLVARGLANAQAIGAAEQVLIQVPTEKVGLIIGRGGETIKSLQTRSGARIQVLIPEGDESKERTVRVTGDKKQTEIAKEMIKEVMNQPLKPSPLSSGFNQQAYRPRGHTGQPQWGARGGHSTQSTAYDYQHRGSYYGGSYPPQHAPRSSFGSGWEQRPASMQGAPPQGGGGYDYYGGQGGYPSNYGVSAPHSTSIPSHTPGHSTPAMGPPSSHANYNYGQPQGPDYGQPHPYPQTAPSQQRHGHGYDESKYENQAPMQHPYGGHGSSQPVHPQSSQPGYASQQQYGKPPSYGMPSQGLPPQAYGPPRASQPGDMPYQGPVPSTQTFSQNVPPQQQYPYSSSGPMQHTYPPHGSAPATYGGYNQPTSGPGYPQQGAHSVSSYGQTGGQAAGYAQVGPTGGYGSYPSSQGYPEQTAQAGYGYQGTQDPGYNTGSGSAYGAPQSGQPGYAQPAPTQPGYDQSVPQSTGYGGVSGS